MTDLEIIRERWGLDEDDAFAVLELCDHLDTEDAIARHGYPKDTPRGRDLAARLADHAYVARLRALAEVEALPAALIDALT